MITLGGSKKKGSPKSWVSIEKWSKKLDDLGPNHPFRKPPINPIISLHPHTYIPILTIVIGKYQSVYSPHRIMVGKCHVNAMI